MAETTTSSKPCSIYSEHLTNTVCNYVHAFGDPWAHLIKMTSHNKRRRTDGESTVNAWEKSLGICNPMLTLSDSITTVSDTAALVEFTVQVDDTYGVTQTAILMLALDSFISLAASSSAVKVKSSKADSSFTVRVPSTVSGEALLNNKGYPVGLCGPFQRWSLNFKSASLGGKGGMAGIAGIVISNNKGFDTSGTGIIERMNSVTSASQQLDDSEMGRTLSMNRRTETGCRFSVSSTRQSNQKDVLHHQSLYNKAALHTAEESPSTKTARKRSRRKGECSANPLTFVDKFVGVTGEGQQPSLPPPSTDFTSLFMTGPEADACYQTCQSLRGASRIKSLLGKYAGRQHDGKYGGRHHEGLYAKSEKGWEWTSPENRRLVVVFPDGTERVIRFKLSCVKSSLFDVVTNTAAGAKHWMRATAQLLGVLGGLEKFLTLMDPTASCMQDNLIRNLIRVFKLRHTIGFRIPDHSKDWIPKRWNVPLSSMGVTSERYDKVIEVMDLLMVGGAFVSSCLNNAYFYERGVKPKRTSTIHKCDRRSWLHLDSLRLASTVLAHKTRALQAAASPPPTRQSMDNAIMATIQNFSDVSSSMRDREIQKCVSEEGKDSIDSLISNKGAFRALVESTVATLAFARVPEGAELKVPAAKKRKKEEEEPALKRRIFCFEDAYDRPAQRKSAVLAALVLTSHSIDSAVATKGNFRRR